MTRTPAERSTPARARPLATMVAAVVCAATSWSGPASAQPRPPAREGTIAGLRVVAIDGAGSEIDLSRQHASLQRTPPEALEGRQALEGGDAARQRDPDALRYVVVGPENSLPSFLDIVSFAPGGNVIGRLPRVALQVAACPPSASRTDRCATTPPIRAVIDAVDAQHPLVAGRSLRAELGGGFLLLSPTGEQLRLVRVAGPRLAGGKANTGAALPHVDRYRGRLRFLLVRLSPNGPPPVGGSESSAREVARTALERVNALWGGCGINFGSESELDVRLVDPPPPHLLVLGCDHGLPASGGTLRVQVGTRSFQAEIDAGMLPAAAARRMAGVLRAGGLNVRVTSNPRIASSAHASVDLSVRDPAGQLVALRPPASGPVSTDATLRACIGHVSLEDGLQHFGDVDAVSGTVEERTLIKAFDGGDPGTIDVVMVPGFAKGGRIGESFIGADESSIRNVVIVDRAGIRSNQASFTLAHELGHVLLDDPGHPDDYGFDTPTQLMDADAANPTAFGPRRLSLSECARAVRQSGPGSPIPLLTPWPLDPLPLPARTGLVRADQPPR